MNEKSNIRIEQSMSVVHIQQTRSRFISVTNTRSMSLVQELSDVRKELKHVTRERDKLKSEVLNSFRII